MPSFTTPLVARAPVADATIAFFFEKPPGIQHIAGQAVQVQLIDPPFSDDKGPRRLFSLASAPSEERLMIAVRMRPSAFKRSLAEVPLGTTVRMIGPFGGVTLDPADAREAVLIAGGIGVTPFRSMIVQAAACGSPRPLTLLYSNRRPEDAAFLDELQAIAGLHPHIRVHATMTGMERSSCPWTGDVERLDAARIQALAPDLQNSVFYVVGPTAMVRAMEDALSQAGVDKARVTRELFPGY